MTRPRRRRAPAPKRPLEGFRVVEMAHHLAAPLAAMHLGDFGADVVKVESLEGEDWRRWGRPSAAGDSQLFLAINRNKRSLSVDIGTREGRRILDRLLASADVFLTNYAPAVLRELRLDVRALRRRHPKLIPCALSAFGTRGPDMDRRAFDLIASGEAGLLLKPEGVPAPLVNAAPLTDTMAAEMLAYGVALALLHRERTGRAQAVESALVNATVALQAHRFIWLDTDAEPDLAPPRNSILYRAYETADGFVTIAVIAKRLFERLCRAADLADVLADPRYTSWARVADWQAELRERFERRFRERTTDEWLKVLGDAGVPAGRVQWGAKVFEHPQLVANRVVTRTRHPTAGAMRTMGFPLALSDTPAKIGRHAPALGAHTARVLAELGYGAARIRKLAADHVVRVAR